MIKLGKHKRGLDYSHDALKMDENNAKAKFREAQARIGMGQLSMGKALLEELQKVRSRSSGQISTHSADARLSPPLQKSPDAAIKRCDNFDGQGWSNADLSRAGSWSSSRRRTRRAKQRSSPPSVACTRASLSPRSRQRRSPPARPRPPRRERTPASSFSATLARLPSAGFRLPIMLTLSAMYTLPARRRN